MDKIEKKERDIRALLGRRGPLSAAEIVRTLDLSQPTFSRLAANMADLLTIGEGRARVYGLPRSSEFYPIVRIGKNAEVTALGDLKLLAPNGAVFVSKDSKLKPKIFRNIPYFVWDLRPQGYLGKIFVSRHPELKLPDRWEDWQESDLYRTLRHRGDDLVGNLVIGHESFREFQVTMPVPIPQSQRELAYPKLAAETLQGTHTGSSAGGEQPKFTALIQTQKDFRHVIVKFSPPLDTEAGRRWGDLLFAEEIALKVLRNAGRLTADVEAFESQGRVFLEVVRFDRIGKRGRRGVLSLGAIDDEYVGGRANWTLTALQLMNKKLIDEADADAIVFLDSFGAQIANSDRHFGNLSLYWELDEERFQLAPIYDMLPMFYAPVQGNVVEKEFRKPIAQVEQIPVWIQAQSLAYGFWNEVKSDRRISDPFRKIAQTHVARIEAELSTRT